MAVLLSLTPGPATALVVRSAAAGGTRRVADDHGRLHRHRGLGRPLGARDNDARRRFRDWCLSLAAAVSRAKRAVADSRFARRVEQVTGAVLLTLAGRLALESR